MKCLCKCNGYEAPALTVDAVIKMNEKILLVRRRREPFRGFWALPGGFVECGETVEKAVIREIEEETGLKMIVKDILGIYSEPCRDPRGHVVSICFLGSAEGVPIGGDDAGEAKFFNISEIDSLKLAFDHNNILKDYIKLRGWKNGNFLRKM